MKNNLSLFLTTCALVFTMISTQPGWGATFVVNTTMDSRDTQPGDGVAIDSAGYCSLRAAIMEANELDGPDIIEIPAGIYTLTIGGKDDHCRYGDLDIRRSLTIKGAGMEDTIIDVNRLDRGIHILGPWEVVISDLTIQNGQAMDGSVYSEGNNGDDGGAILNIKANLTLTRVAIQDCAAGKAGFREYDMPTWMNGGNGGGLCNGGTATLIQCLIANNTGGDGERGGHGGGIYNTGSLTLSNCRVIENHAGSCAYPHDFKRSGGGDGGGVYNKGGQMNITHSEICHNQAGDGTTSIDYFGIPGSGGGVYNEGQIYESILANCTISHNTTTESGIGPGYGGGICNHGQLTITHCTVYHNIVHLTLSSDNIGYGGGIYNAGALIKLGHTIVAANRVGLNDHGPDLCGSFTSLGYNLIGTSWGHGYRLNGIFTGNLTGADPKLADLADNGGFTRTQRLLSGSPAIDAGSPNCPITTDQRGISRPQDGDNDGDSRIDIGAFEVLFPTIEITEPMHGQTVAGTIRVKATCNMTHAEFFVDDHSIHIDSTAPFACDIDTTTLTNGIHEISAKGFDIPEISATDTIMLETRNVGIQLDASRLTARGWLFRRTFTRLTITATSTPTAATAKYILFKRQGSSSYQRLREIPATDLDGTTIVVNDLEIEKDLEYTYRVEARNAAGQRVGQSEEKTI